MNLVEDEIFENRLKNEISVFLDRYKTDRETLLPVTTHIQCDKGNGNMPPDFHVAVKKLPDSETLLYLFFDVGTLRVNEEYESLVRPILFFSFRNCPVFRTWPA